MTSPSTHIAAHLREAVFRAYEPLITRAVAAFPDDNYTGTETEFTVPPGVAPTTFLANFRNAILSLKIYKWSPTTVDVDKLTRITGRYILNQDSKDSIWFRIKAKRGRPNEMKSEARSRAPQIDSAISLVPWADTTQDEISALCLLLHTRRITGPVAIAGEIGESLIQSLTSTYDVGIAYDATSNTTIIT